MQKRRTMVTGAPDWRPATVAINLDTGAAIGCDRGESPQEKRTMIQNAKACHEPRDSSLKNAEPRGCRDAGFKPVALPALAAAVRMTARPQPRKPSYADIPAILREDAPID